MKEIKVNAKDYEDEQVRFPALEIVDLKAEAAAVADGYKNMVISRMNDHCLRLSTMTGVYPWHCHPDSDELFLVMEGRLTIELADGRELHLDPWQVVTVPAGTVHRTRARGRVMNLCVEAISASTEFTN